MSTKRARQLRKTVKQRLSDKTPWVAYSTQTFHEVMWRVPLELRQSHRDVVRNIKITNPITLDLSCGKAIYKRLKKLDKIS